MALHNFANKHMRLVLLFVICAVLIAAACVAILFLRQEPKPPRKRTAAPEAVCPDYALFVGHKSVDEAVSSVPVVVTAKREQDTENGVTFTVKQVLKGGQLLEGDVIEVCPNFSVGRADETFDTTLLLLRGKTKDKGLWSPTQAEFGVLPARKSDGKFLIKSIFGPGTYYSTKDIEEAIVRDQ